METTRDEKKRHKTQREEHSSLIQEPGISYIGHSYLFVSDAKPIANDISRFSLKKEIDFSKIDCIYCDGCPTNTGKHECINILHISNSTN